MRSANKVGLVATPLSHRRHPANQELIGEWMVDIVKLECELWAAKQPAKR